MSRTPISAIAGDMSESEPTSALETRRAAAPTRLNDRKTMLTNLNASPSVTTTIYEVDPKRCRLWAQHNRDYDALNVENCADLISSLKTSNRQEIPAIGRRVTGDPDFDYEVICGARRHWCVSYLRKEQGLDLPFRIEVRTMDDVQAFCISDAENRTRLDISPYERAVEYKRGLELHFNNNQGTMATRLGINRTTLSFFLDLARLPVEIVEAYRADLHQLKEYHARKLRDLVGNEGARKRMANEAQVIINEQRAALSSGRPLIGGAVILHRLMAAGLAVSKEEEPKIHPEPDVTPPQDGREIVRVQRRSKKLLTLTLRLDTGGGLDEILAEVRKLLETPIDD